MKPAKLFSGILVLIGLALMVSGTLPAAAQDRSTPDVQRGAELVEIVTPLVFDGDLRDLPPAEEWRPGDPIREIPRRQYPRPGQLPDEATPRPAGQGLDPLLATQERAAGSSDPLFSAPSLNLAGQGYSGVNPPDTVGDVGTTYYIQMINGSGGGLFRIHDKVTGNVVAGPTALDSLWSGPGQCGNGFGDGVVLYDQLADRWMLSEFANSGSHLCVYVSQNGNPITGGWFAYDFTTANFPDYPKYAVWPDAYYVGTNENTSAVYALERDQMLLGNPAASQRFTIADLSGFSFQALIPSDVDGPAPPVGSPNYFMRHRDDERHNPGSNNPTQDFLEVWEFDVDWTSPASSSITGPFNIAVTEFDSGLCGFTSFNCFPQPGSGVTLDPLREVVMWRLQYRNFGTHETMVGNLVTDVDGSDRGGKRWFELRKSGGNWALFQEGTYSPDSLNRWMGAIAMDGDGNIALAYNVSDAIIFPGLRYTGRLATDPSGTMSQGETVLVSGSAANASNRYGDYASMNVDPVDDCTFWFTGEYNTGSQWSTRIGSFSFASCGTPQTCGNNVKEGTETCDGIDLGGETCGSQSCTGGGTLACNGTCSGFDTSACSGCPACDNDFVCESGEDCNNCSNDCISGSTSGAVCGNGLCEAGNGEDCLSCPQDCNGKQNGNPGNRFCCGDGDGQNPAQCSDSRCSTGGWECTDVPAEPSSYCCGDLACEGAESSNNCAVDCGAEPFCGDGSCNGSEDRCSCELDCGPAPASEVPNSTCHDGLDNDCGGGTDCLDTDCSTDPFCSCLPKNAFCTLDSQCCSEVCKPNGRCR